MELSSANEIENAVLPDTHECFQDEKVMPDCVMNSSQNTNDDCWSSNVSHEKKDAMVANSIALNVALPSSDNLSCLKSSEQLLDHFKFSINKPNVNHKKAVEELSKYSQKQLQILIEDLTRSVEEVSSELVQLLLENDSLQQESDARNIAIEQLLKLTVKVAETELRPVQMSVSLPDEDCEVT